MRISIVPPLHTWRPSPPPAATAADRTALVTQANAHAHRLGTGQLPGDASIDRPPIIATGHQAWLWHPGILAKDMAMAEACRRLQGQPLHLVVDQDAHEALTLELPRQQGKAITTQTLRLASHRTDVPTGAQPPVDSAAVRERLQALGDERVSAVIEAFANLPPCRTLAEQIAVVTTRLMAPWLATPGSELADAVPVLFTSDLPSLPGYQRIVQQMIADARRCVRAYNAAVRATPDAGLTELVELRELVELPLWAVRWGRPRGRVFVDLADREPWLVDEVGNLLDREAVSLLPRALLLTATMRSLACDLFIHGKGGGLYDQAMERWWHGWQGESAARALAPMAVVSADIYLPFEDVPVSQPADVAKAVWYRHHLPHNVDRILGLDGPLVQRKRNLLAHMHDDRNRKRRRHAFEQLHAINEQFVAEHPELLRQADMQLADARQGLLNAQLAGRRDWCFALYPSCRLRSLRAAIARQP